MPTAESDVSTSRIVFIVKKNFPQSSNYSYRFKSNNERPPLHSRYMLVCLTYNSSIKFNHNTLCLFSMILLLFSFNVEFPNLWTSTFKGSCMRCIVNFYCDGLIYYYNLNNLNFYLILCLKQRMIKFIE